MLILEGMLDPNNLSRDGTVALSGTKVSDDGKLLAYGIAAAGSDWNEWKVRDVATGKDLSDHLKWIKFSSAEWSPDGKGFYYGRFPEPKPGDDLKGANFYQKLIITGSARRRPTIFLSGKTKSTRNGKYIPRSATMEST